MSTKQAANLRRRHNIPAPGRWPADRVPKHLRLRPPMPPDELAALEPGHQPALAGHLLCRECGQWNRSLPHHLAFTHHLTAQQYRDRHHLAPNTPLRGIAMDATDAAHPTIDPHPDEQQPDQPAATPRQQQRPKPPQEAPLDLPPGVQPERPDALQCRECGNWYKGLGAHLAHKHQISADDYRTRHGLPRNRSLDAPSFTEKRRAIGLRRFNEDPQAMLTKLTPTRSTAQQRAAWAKAARQESDQRPGAQGTREEAGRRGGAHARRKSIEADQARATAAGYPHPAALLEATAHLNGHDLAALLNVPYHTAIQYRHRHGYRSPGGPRNPYPPTSLTSTD